MPVRDGGEGGEEEGHIDGRRPAVGGRRLVQRIASPTEWRLLRLEGREPVADCSVNALID